DAQAQRTTPRSVWYTPPATAEPVAPTQTTGIHLHPSRPRGLLEPDAGTTRTSGSEGAPMRQRVGATRHPAGDRPVRHGQDRLPAAAGIRAAVAAADVGGGGREL